MEVDRPAIRVTRSWGSLCALRRRDREAEVHGGRQHDPAEDPGREERLVGSPALQRRDSASYGLLLRNTSPNVNALKVSVQVNFVLADSRLVGTATQFVPSIGAGETYNYAGQLAFPGTAPIAKLEFVIIVGARQKTAKTPRPGIDNVRDHPFAVRSRVDGLDPGRGRERPPDAAC